MQMTCLYGSVRPPHSLFQMFSLPDKRPTVKEIAFKISLLKHFRVSLLLMCSKQNYQRLKVWLGLIVDLVQISYQGKYQGG